MTNLCKECNNPVPETKNHNKKVRDYCSSNCSKSAYTKRLKEQERRLKSYAQSN